jgi:hypothetical protein
MLDRCNCVNDSGYERYGGRGIKVCERWSEFDNFLEDMGEKPDPTFTLDRIDNNLGYYKENCKWSSRAEQAQNRRKRKGSTTQYTGVYFDKARQKYRARVNRKDLKKCLGFYSTPEEAKLVYDKAIASIGHKEIK